MKKPALSALLGWRFLRARKRSSYLSFISVSSAVGITLGVAALIIVLSAMNGFQKELSQRLLAVFPQAELISTREPVVDWRDYIKVLEQQPQVVAASPFIRSDSLLSAGTHLKYARLRGVKPALEAQVSRWQDFVEGADQPLVKSGSLVIGQALADDLGVKVGDKISVLVPRPDSQGNQLRAPRQKLFTLTGIFHFGGQLDGKVAYITLADAQQLAGYEDTVQGIRLKVADPFQAATIARQAASKLPIYFYLRDWTRTQGHVYQDIQMVRMIVYLVMIIVAAVASFNIVSTLVLAVQDKRSSIAILLTMGASRGTIMRAFMIQGALNGAAGAIMGAVLGVLGSWYLGPIMAGLEWLMGHRLLSADIYFIDFIPSDLHWHDVFLTAGVAMATTLIATIYPALRASKVQPARALSRV